MRRKLFGLLSLFLMAGFTVFAGNKTEKIEVKGNCGMCEKRIEKAAMSVDGVSKADWDKETKKLEVTFNDEKTGSEKIQEAVAAVGHDTEKFKADDKVYESLPGCCKYRK